ncbi:OmpA family protein [Dechloromonas sp. ZY10]|uniref:OmpA family protein n=1 Tax=Dechloromonas aquae TaxID=2664436 RepID=UPI0035273B7A
MRASLPATLLLSSLLAACAIKGDIPPSKHISQKGALKVHPGLLGQPVPPELQGETRLAAATPGAGTDATGGQPALGDPLNVRSIHFDLDSAAIKADYDTVLQAHARHLAANPALRIRIEGHADERGPSDYNRRLGQKRADSVRQTLLNHGAPENRIGIRSLGESKPRQKGHDEESWAENRRAELVYEK